MVTVYVVQLAGSEFCDDSYAETIPPSAIFKDEHQAKLYKESLEKEDLVESILDSGWRGAFRCANIKIGSDLDKKIWFLMGDKENETLDENFVRNHPILEEILKERWEKYKIFPCQLVDSEK